MDDETSASVSLIMKEFEFIVIVGLGGDIVLRDITGFYIERVDPNYFLRLADGGHYAMRHWSHEKFSRLAEKTEVSKELLLRDYKNLKIRTYPFFIGRERTKLSILAKDVIPDHSFVFDATDNAASKKLIMEYCEKLKQVVLISGGIDKENVYVQTFVRIDGKNVTPPFYDYNPHIKNPKDELPSERLRRGCLDQAQGEKPNIFSLMMVDALSLCVFYKVLEHLQQGTIQKFNVREIFFNIFKMQMRTVASKP